MKIFYTIRTLDNSQIHKFTSVKRVSEIVDIFLIQYHNLLEDQDSRILDQVPAINGRIKYFAFDR